MRLTGLMKPLKNSVEYKKIIKDAEEEKFPIGIYGIADSAKSYIINSIYEAIDKPLYVFTSSDIEAKNVYEDLSLYINEVYYFPSKDVVFYNIDAISGDLRWERLKVIKEMVSKGKKIIVTSIEALTPRYTPAELFTQYTSILKAGDIINLKEFSERLVQAGYERVDMVEGKGQFAIRGGVLDIYPTISVYPYRIELFDDEIDSIRTFNAETQRSIEKADEIEIFPAKEVILTSDNIQKGYERIEDDFKNFISKKNVKNKKDVTQKIKNIVRANLESLKETWSFETIENYLPYFYDKTSTFFDFIKDAYIIVDDVQRSSGKLDSVYTEFEYSYSTFLERGDILPLQGELLIARDVLDKTLEIQRVFVIEGIAKTTPILKPRSVNSFTAITPSSYHGQLELLIEDIKDKKSKNYKILILSGTRTRGERLVNTLRDEGIESSYSDEVKEIADGQVVVTFGNLLYGYDYPELKLSVISDKEVFGEAKRKAPKRKTSKKGIGKIKSFTELRPGDYVVHTNHGVGIYKGIKEIEVQGNKRGYLEITYDKGDQLYVPVDQLDLVQKYIGNEGKAPKINKLGGSEWNKAKAKAKKSINEIAGDLVKLYAARSALKGYKFSKDTVWQRQFEDEFPYEETPDQLTSLEDIKHDMESDKPMDRLICGDVGYGKTEVALRAAFKAVMDGKQVAFLVPTTILAEQHYNNMKKRFSDFPVKIDVIGRFRSASQQKETIKGVKEGSIDILIGTHRLVSKDIQFKDLGLLIIDEEQRFGVAQKEKIKNIKKNIDVITLSATPIPRTLNMSLTGVRDISVIETPPEERYPIQTYVVEYNDQLIKDAILRELNRSGQVYFVYNRVEDIKNMASYLQKLIPDSSVGIIHGQMNEKEIENVMRGFMNKEIDILVCTTIIETGIDIQNVNTMVVYDADRMGLSQLYQLRGRVGRSDRIAYAYFTYKKDKVLTETSEKRLKALKDFTELGSGFKIAMKDLEIRGAGNMIGSAQHGHMAAIGYDLYCRMLEDTIKVIKGTIDKEPIETTMDVKVDAYIPDSYIGDEMQKIEVYKKIAAIESMDDIMEIKEELEDRFSTIPDSVYNLMNIAYIRSRAKLLGIEEIKEKGEEVIFQFESKGSFNNNTMKALMKKYSRNIIFKLGEKPAFAFKLSTIAREDMLQVFKNMLEYLIEYDK